MATFPSLRTGAVAQYPFSRSLQFQTQSVRFLDGSQQRFRIRRQLRAWSIRLDLLDQQELGSLISFFEQQGTTPFGFTDPISGEVASKCVLADNTFGIGIAGELDANASLRIEETE